MNQELKYRYVFGEFCLEGAEKQLLRSGVPVSLPPKILDTLLLLVENAGHLVGKDQFMTELWPGTFVGDDALARNISILRKALGESSDSQSFIATVPTRGYRFVAAVQKVNGALPSADGKQVAAQSDPTKELEGSGAGENRSQEAKAEGIVASAPNPAHNGTPQKTRIVRRILPLAAFAVAAIVAVLFFPRTRTTTLASSDFVLVSDFVNTTGEPVFDGTLKQAVSVKLAESPYFNLVPDNRIRQVLKLMNRPGDERVVPPISREVCQRAGAKVAVSGSILQLGNLYELELLATDCLTGTKVADEKITATDKEKVLANLGKALPNLRRNLGECISSIQKFDTPIEQATTKSLAALKAFTSGDQKRAQGKEGESLPDYKLATELDPDFAMAYARLAAVTRSLMQVELADEYMRKAFERREHISEREKFYVQAHYYADTAHESENELEAYRLWSEVYPNDFYAFNGMAAVLIEIGQADKAVAAAQQALRVNPDHALPYATLARAFERRSQFPEAKEICKKAIEEKVDAFWIHTILFRISFAEKDEAGMRKELDWFRGKPLEGAAVYYQAKGTLSQGKAREARQLFEQAGHLAEERGVKEQAVAMLNGQAQFAADIGNLREARTLAELSLRKDPNIGRHRAFATMALARAGDATRAEALLKEMKGHPFLGTGVNAVVIPCTQAAVALNRQDPAAAIAVLQPAVPYDFGQDSGGITAYYRGLAGLQLKTGKEAAAEFQSIVDHRGVVDVDIYWPLTHLGLARAYAMTGETEKSLAEYREALNFWKDADGDFEPAKQAKAEYSKLSGKQFAISH